jgi:phosphoglycerate dehydrogenase-like enzyme
VTSVDRRPVIILHPASQSSARIFTADSWRRLHASFEVVDLEADPTDEALDAALPEAFAVVGQPDLPRERLLAAPRMRALLNVEGNFLPNVDYATCFEKGMHVLNCGPAFGQAVAEYALALALDLARGISREDRAFREGREQYFGRSNADAVLLRHATVGLLGYGHVGRALHRLLVPFAPTLRVFDPWLPDAVLREADVAPAQLEDALRSQFVFVAATITDTNRHLLNAERLDLLPAGARLILVSRAAIVDYEAMLDRVEAGRFLAAIDVWPQEPAPADLRARTMEGLVLSAHRAGGIAAALHQIGDMVVDDLLLIASGLPPVRMQAGARELVTRYRNQARQ